MRRRLLLGAVAVLATSSLAQAGPASAEDVTVTGDIAVRSVNVSVSSLILDDCDGTATKLLIPSGLCNSPQFTVKNGDAPARVLIAATDATVGAGSWTLCQLGANGDRPCTGPGADTGIDEFQVLNGYPDSANSFHYQTVETQFACDFAFVAGGNCIADPAATVTEILGISGPTASTSPALSYSFTVTYTAAPPE